MGVSELVESGQRLDGEAVGDILVPAVHAHGVGDTVGGQPGVADAVRREVADAASHHARHFEQAERTGLCALPGRGIQTPPLRPPPHAGTLVFGHPTVRELGHHERRVREADGAGGPQDPGIV